MYTANSTEIENEAEITYESVPLNSVNIRDYLADYLDHKDRRHHKSCLELTLNIIGASFGACWGIPWINAAYRSSSIIPNERASNILGVIIASGFVIAAGENGIWISLAIGSNIGSRSSEAHNLIRRTSRENQYKYLRMIGAFILSGFSCISPVYGAIKYNNGAEKLLGIITLIGNGLYSFYSYNLSLQAIINRFHTKSHEEAAFEQIRGQVVRNMNQFISGEEPITNSANIVKNIFTFPHIEQSRGQPSSINCRNVMLGLTSFTIACGSSLFGIFMAKEFFAENICDSPYFYYPAAIFSELPGFVTSVLSTFNVFNQLINILTCQKNSSEKVLIKTMYPIAARLLPGLGLIIALTAPSAAAYATYSTLSEQKDMSNIITWLATGTISLSRFIFSIFTSQSLSDILLFKLYDKLTPKNKTDQDLSTRNSLASFKNEVVVKANPASFARFFKSSYALPARSEEEDRDKLPKRSRSCCACTIL